MGSFRPVAGSLHLHRQFNFTESLVETVPRSLRLSCGSELTDKEFRYLRTVIVTAAVYWGSIQASPSDVPFNLPALGRRQPLYFILRFCSNCVFDKQSPGPFHCGWSCDQHSFSRSYGVILPSSLMRVPSLTLGFSPRLPVSVCGTGS